MEIINLIQKIKEEAEKLEPSRKEQLLDMSDSYETAIKHLLDPTAEELEVEIHGSDFGKKDDDEDQARETKDLDEKERFSQMEDKALSDMAERNFD